MSGLEQYIGGQKATWRGWQWNSCVQRLPEFDGMHIDVRKRNNFIKDVCSEKTVIYLCGPSDVDREHARRFGFRDENVIAVDLDPARTGGVTKNGHPVINSDLSSVVANWPDDWRIDLIVADFCCGFSRQATDFGLSLFASGAVSDRTVVSLNLLRGRDRASNLQRAFIQSLRQVIADYDQSWGMIDVKHQSHRGACWWEWCDIYNGALLAMMSNNSKYKHVPADFDKLSFGEQLAYYYRVSAEWRQGRVLRSRYALTSYRSEANRANFMDTIVFRFWDRNQGFCADGDTGSLKALPIFHQMLLDRGCDHSARRKIAAMKAWRTMRNRSISV